MFNFSVAARRAVSWVFLSLTPALQRRRMREGELLGLEVIMAFK